MNNKIMKINNYDEIILNYTDCIHDELAMYRVYSEDLPQLIVVLNQLNTLLVAMQELTKLKQQEILNDLR